MYTCADGRARHAHTARTGTEECTLTRTHLPGYKRASTHACKHWHASKQARMPACTCQHTHASMPACPHARTDACAHMHSRAHTRTAGQLQPASQSVAAGLAALAAVESSTSESRVPAGVSGFEFTLCARARPRHHNTLTTLQETKAAVKSSIARRSTDLEVVHRISTPARYCFVVTA